MECSAGKTTADLKVDLRGKQSVVLTVQTPYSGFRQTEVTHSLTHMDSGFSWAGAANFGGQSFTSGLTLAKPATGLTADFQLHTPYTSDLKINVEQNFASMTNGNAKMEVSYGDVLRHVEAASLRLDATP